MKLTDRQKAQLKKHMDGHPGTPTEKRSHRMKMMTRMVKGMSLNAAHKDIMGTKGRDKFVKKNTPAKVRRRGGYGNPVPSADLEAAFRNSRDQQRGVDMIRTDMNNNVRQINGRNTTSQQVQERVDAARRDPNAGITTTDNARYYFLNNRTPATDARRQDYLYNARLIATGNDGEFYDRPIGQRRRVPTPPPGGQQ
tara:strand:+ start:557 stop:1144 length:588 start_codon:yes stop_codon:yes gene_type:complete